MNRFLTIRSLPCPFNSKERKNRIGADWSCVRLDSLTPLFFQLPFLIASHFLTDCIDMYAHVTAFARSGNPQLKYTAGQMPDLQNRMSVNNREMKRGEPVSRNPPLESMHFVFFCGVPFGKRKTLNHETYFSRSMNFSLLILF